MERRSVCTDYTGVFSQENIGNPWGNSMGDLRTKVIIKGQKVQPAKIPISRWGGLLLFANLTLFTWLSNMNDHWEVRGKKRSFVVSKCSAGLIASRRLMHAMPRMGLYLCIDSHGHFLMLGYPKYLLPRWQTDMRKHVIQATFKVIRVLKWKRMVSKKCLLGTRA